MAATFWPGVAVYDTVALYNQVLTNNVDDWQPPIMVRMWQLLHHLGGTTGPMFVLQVALYASGFALIVAALWRAGRWRAAIAAAVLALSPLLLGWQMVVLKDAQMQGALLAAFGFIAWFRLSSRPVPTVAVASTALLIAYATLVRANAVFATIPFAVLLLPRPRPRTMAYRGAIALASILVILAVSPSINQGIFGAVPSGIAKSQPLFDLSAIAVAAGDPAPFSRAERDQIASRHCAKNFFWDPMGDPGTCGPVTERVKGETERQLYAQLARSAVTHPVVYGLHRARHWNSTERWWVPAGLIEAGPPAEAEPNDIGLVSPQSPLVGTWQDVAGDEAATPLGWPIVWTVLDLLLLPIAWTRRQDSAGALALALLGSALALESSFLVISISSDLRYHLWPMAASALALILLSKSFRVTRRGWIGAGGVLSLVIAGAIYARATLPRAPDSYQAMLHAPSG